MLIAFLYHRVSDGKYANPIEVIEKQFTYLSKKYKIIVPSDKINLLKLDICLSFDDAYYDFYHYVFPLLKKLNIKAQLAVPVKFIQDSTEIDPEIRLSVPYGKAMKDKNFLKKVPFCTWQEINEMASSGLVNIASHSYSHKNLLENDIDLNIEIIQSKKILEDKIKQKISTFVYPFGKFNENIHKFTKKHYKYVMRIGSTFNLTWQNINKISYRIISDNLKTIDEHLKLVKGISYVWF